MFNIPCGFPDGLLICNGTNLFPFNDFWNLTNGLIKFFNWTLIVPTKTSLNEETL